MVHKHGDGRTVKTSETVFEIIEVLQAEGATGVTDLADATGLAPSTVHGHLTTLLQNEYVVKEDQKYRLGLKFTKLGRDVRNNVDIVSAGNPILRDLAEDTGEEAWITIEENGYSVAVMQESANKGIESVGVISRYTNIHNSGAGKAVLAHLPEERAKKILDERGLPPSTYNTITDRDELSREIEQIRDQGYALSDEERYVGIRAVFSPVIVGEKVHGAIGVAGPSNRLCDELFREELPSRVMEASNEIELKLRYPKFNDGTDG